jgi:hypothetical protein
VSGALASLMTAVEDELSAYYGFPLLAASAGHLITREDLRAALGERAEQTPEWQARAGVWVVPDAEQAFVGITLDAPLTDALAARDPRAGLANDNLDAFCILIEELSHFHLLLNRMTAGRPVTRSELEMQGELDKLLICARTLKRQSGDYHVVELARTLYDTAKITAADAEPYIQATKLAARFWFRRAEDSPDAAAVRASLQALYEADWAEKRRSA